MTRHLFPLCLLLSLSFVQAEEAKPAEKLVDPPAELKATIEKVTKLFSDKKYEDGLAVVVPPKELENVKKSLKSETDHDGFAAECESLLLALKFVAGKQGTYNEAEKLFTFDLKDMKAPAHPQLVFFNVDGQWCVK